MSQHTARFSGPGDNLVDYAFRLCEERLAAYRAAPHDAEEHANIEMSVLAGGYAYRQIAELIQNAADAISEGGEPDVRGRIVVEVDGNGLWAANSGAPVDAAGVKALLNSHASGKRAGQIGRFGLGFKSLLKLGGRIDVLSRSVCLRFDPEWCRAYIRTHLSLNAGAPVPGLRMAVPETWQTALPSVGGSDRFGWATTVVHAELIAAGAREAVTEEIRRFPSEFLLFLPHDIDLELRSGDVDRRLVRRTEADGSILIEDLAGSRPAAQRWRVFQTSAQITDEAALEDATAVHARQTVPLIWAAPVGTQRESAGRFFAFFPTSTETRTLGILNAPWKLNSDRTALIQGAWNAALMERAADLIVASLPLLAADGDPAVVLDAFPRELATANEPAAPLVAALWSRLLDAAVVPNCDGELLEGSALFRAPTDAMELIQRWSEIANPEACEQHLHPGCTASLSRIARLAQLADRLATRKDGAGPRLARTPAASWLEHTASDEPAGAGPVLELADTFAGSVPNHIWETVRDRLRIIPVAGGGLATAADVVLGDHPEAPLLAVHSVIAAESRYRKILHDRFQVRDESETDWQRVFRTVVSRAQTSGDWSEAWKLLRRMPWNEATEAIDDHYIEVRTLTGWSDPDDVFRPGSLLDTGTLATLRGSASESEIAAVILDENWHAQDAALLGALEVGEPGDVRWQTWDAGEQPTTKAGRWLVEWQKRWASKYHGCLNHRPDLGLLRAESVTMPTGWGLLLHLGGDTSERITRWLLEAVAASEKGYVRPVEFRHSTRPDTYEKKRYPHPLWDLIRFHGLIGVGEARLTGESLIGDNTLDRARSLPALAPLMSGLERLSLAGETWRSPRKKEDVWNDWLALAAHDSAGLEALTPFYLEAARHGFAPVSVYQSAGPAPIADIRVAASPRDAALATAAGIAAIALDTLSSRVWIAAGAGILTDVSRTTWTRSAAFTTDMLLVETEPMVRDAIRTEFWDTAALAFAASLGQTIGSVTQEVPWALVDGGLVVHEEFYRNSPWTQRMTWLVEGAAACGWTADGDILVSVLTQGAEARRREVAGAPTLAARLVRACGESAVTGLFESDIQTKLMGNPLLAAEVAITLFGPALLTLPEIREAMTLEGLEPPERWGGEAAMTFVAEIGFPADFAAPADRKRDPELAVTGPLPLKPLHDFQEEVALHIDRLLTDTSSKRRRAVISLPTGAGKTRVAAQTAVTRILEPAGSNRLILWIAQTDELCEQAVQCFRELWVNLGASGETLRIVRLWGGQVTPRPSAASEPTVIVASIQTLSSRMIDEGLAWARDPALLVIDECHHALAPSYTGALRWLNPGIEAEGREPPILGLSATPFRGRNDEESSQLARRFDGRLIPLEQATLFDRLQDRGVLARFGYERLEIDTGFVFTPEERWKIDRFGKVPDTALERLGEIGERNDLIVDAICDAPEKSALVFATSVAHGRRLAAQLNLRGVSAAAVSGETDRSSRRWFIAGFRRGDIRVLCNHSALTTGFDAPATDLIVIARPVFSPALYMQMAGRGLRGPANGGKERCRILTVQDNLDQYTDQLAHHYFEQHYVTPL